MVVSRMTTIASKTQLPPSPELNALSGSNNNVTGGDSVPLFSLNNDNHPSHDNNNNNNRSRSNSNTQPPPPRLRSVARYSSYRPQTLATSHVLPNFRTSLGAVAGSLGVAIFRVSEPQTPLALLNHSSAGIGSLAFQPDAQYLLAGSRGSVVLIWDAVAGPLTDRCEVAGSNNNNAAATSSSSSEPLSSLDWRSAHILTASTPSTACLWDVRQSNRSKPTLRFGTHEIGGAGNSSYVQIANKDADHQVALLDAGGILRIWDWRYVEEGGYSRTAIDTIQVFRSVGIGLAALPLPSSWVVWGYERVNEGAIAKVLAPETISATATTESEELTQNTPEELEECSPYTEAEVLQTPNLTCVRVQDNHIVTMGVQSDGWQANVWKIKSEATLVDPVVSFSSSRNFGTVFAADLALSTFPRIIEEGGPHGNFSHRTSGLLLVNLTEEGYVTTHSIPEAMESLPTSSDLENDKNDVVNARVSKSIAPTASTRIIPEDRDVGDVARAWGSKPDTSDERGRTVDDMPFDMDVPVAYSIPSTDVHQQLRRGENAPSAGSTAGTVSQDSGDEAPVRLQIDARRIACPRLCGATFAMGGGLAVFANGEVRRMWTWYSMSLNREDGDFSGRRALAAGEKRGLRTLHDLQNMMKAAKDAQWGEQSDGEASSVTSQQLGMGFFEDDSDDDSSDSVDPDSDDTVEMTGDKAKGMYEAYFGDFRRPLTRASSTDSKLVRPSSEVSGETLGGPSSDMLQPIVKVSRAFDKMSMNSQSRELAMAWKLGDLELDIPLSNSTDYDEDNQKPGLTGENLPRIPSALSPPRFLAPGYRLISQSPRQQPGLYPIASDPLISPSKPSRSKKFNVAYDADETGVHGGEYSVRPQMKESMVFLKKLVNYQQESGGVPGTSGYRGIMSPPDGPSVHQRPTRTTRAQTATGTARQGAYVLRRTKYTNDSGLEAVKLVCEHNAKISADFGYNQKAETWNLLAQVVSGRIRVANSGKLKPKASLAVGNNIVRLVLEYYEKQGDVQMLSTLVCVLRQEKRADKANGPPLLPDGKNAQYDCYLRRYSDLLYSWGLLSLRAQLNKRLHFVYESREVFGVPSLGNDCGGIAIFSECPHCHQQTTTNYCNNCSDYAFRCIICDTAVRGLFTVCSDCGHGGHIQHLHEWFETQKECPAGCGCRCALLVPQPEQQRINDRSLS